MLRNLEYVVFRLMNDPFCRDYWNLVTVYYIDPILSIEGVMDNFSLPIIKITFFRAKYDFKFITRAEIEKIYISI